MSLQIYPAILLKDRGAGAAAPVGVVFPDLPGCVSQGDDPRHAAEMALEALAAHVEAMLADGDALPPPSPPGQVPNWLDPTESEILVHLLVPVELPGRSLRVNITVDEGLLQRIDHAATVHGFTRSGLLAKAARQWLQSETAGGRRA